MNKIVICGRLTKDPELRTTNNGTEVCGFTVAVDRRVKKNDKKEADFIDCTAWGKPGYSSTLISIKRTASPWRGEWNHIDGKTAREKPGFLGALPVIILNFL